MSKKNALKSSDTIILPLVNQSENKKKKVRKERKDKVNESAIQPWDDISSTSELLVTYDLRNLVNNQIYITNANDVFGDNFQYNIDEINNGKKLAFSNLLGPATENEYRKIIQSIQEGSPEDIRINLYKSNKETVLTCFVSVTPLFNPNSNLATSERAAVILITSMSAIGNAIESGIGILPFPSS